MDFFGLSDGWPSSLDSIRAADATRSVDTIIDPTSTGAILSAVMPAVFAE
jgi:hypothetical protein